MTRRDEILKLIVEYFIKTAQPVGSKTLQEAYNLEVSTATIRNEMNALENDGFLEKPHTSAGRVPSEKGYQYYVDNLRTGSVDERAKNALQSVLSERSKSVEEIIKESCEILSQMTNLTSVIVGNALEEEHLVSIQLTPIASNTATAIFLTDKGHVESKNFVFEENIDPNDVAKTIKLLNDRLSGTSVSDVIPKMEAMKPALTDYVVGQELIYQAIFGIFSSFATSRMEFYGKEKLLNQPEFANDAKKIRELLKFIEDPTGITRVIEKGETKNGITITIGSSNSDKLSDQLALVSAEIDVPGEKGAKLSLVGPSRMNYDKVVTTLEYFAEQLEEYFGVCNRKDDEECKKETKKRTTTSQKTKKTTKK